MKLAARTFRIQWDIHAWVGVVASLLVFVIFFFGVFAMFLDELMVWQDPALHVAPPRAAAHATDADAPSFDRALAAVAREQPIPPGAQVGFVRREGTRSVFAYVWDPGTGAEHRLWADPAIGTAQRERTRLADELYAMHFLYRFPRGFELSGLVAVALLVALAGGLVIHLKDLRRQWWQFRPALRLRFSASDAHKVLGVFGLPFAASLAWSGAILCLVALIGQGLVASNLRGADDRLAQLRGLAMPPPPAIDRSAPALPLDRIVREAQQLYSTLDRPDFVELQLDGAAHARVGVHFRARVFEEQRHATFDATTGALLSRASDSATPASAFERVLHDLHFGRYGGRFLRILYAVLALAMCAVVVTGNLIWLQRRDPRRARLGNRILERLTVGVAAGAVFASAIYFAANRALPWDLAQRSVWELRALLVAWALAILAALIPRWSPRRLAAALLLGAAAAFAGVVVADMARLDIHLFTALGAGVPAVFVANLVLVALALGCAALSWSLTDKRRATIDDAASP